jgi:hypothetical protein
MSSAASSSLRELMASFVNPCAGACELGDLRLLGGKVAAGLCCAFACPFAGDDQLSAGALGYASMPIAASMSCALCSCSRASSEPVDSLTVELVGDSALTEQRARARLEPERQVGAGRLRSLGQQLERGRRSLAPTGARGCLDQLGQRADRNRQLVPRIKEWLPEAERAYKPARSS